MDKVIIISENNHGFLACAASVDWAIDYLIRMGWLDETVETWINHDWVRLYKSLGEDWEEKVRHFDFSTFNNFFADVFQLEERPIYQGFPTE